jgi:sugar phosphate isomerase/epimerase
MRLGVVSGALDALGFDGGLRYCQDLGLDSIEIGCGGFRTVFPFGDPRVLCRDATARDHWLDTIQRHGLSISALAIHGEPLSPDPARASAYDALFRASCELAAQSGIAKLTLLAGIPEGAPGDRAPCWVVTPFPAVNRDTLAWQWEERVLPYWRPRAQFAQEHGCRLCFEMHANDVVHSPGTLLRLRAGTSDNVGATLDPSHLFWQGIDVVEAIRALDDAVFHVHAKDVRLGPRARVEGVLDTTPFDETHLRTWAFCTPGEGHGPDFWHDMVDALRATGFHGSMSIEHEDPTIRATDGVARAAALLQPIVAGLAA